MTEHQPLYLKQVGFVGRMKNKSELRDIVYLLGGAPVDNIAVFTDYVIVGDGGEKTQGFQKIADGVKKGYNIALTPEQLRDIYEGNAKLPLQKPFDRTGVIYYTTPEIEARCKKEDILFWQYKRDLYVERYGAPMADGSRVKTNVRMFKALVEVVSNKAKEKPQ